MATKKDNMRTRYEIIVALVFLSSLRCAYVPEYISAGEGICTDFPSNSTKERIISNDSSFVRAKAFYTYGYMDSLIAYYKNQQIESIIRFVNGDFDGKSEEFYRNGKLKSIVTFNQGIEIYKSRMEFDSLGKELFEWSSDEKGTEKYLSIYPTGEKKYEFRYRNNTPNGFHRQWRANGSLVFEFFYIDGKQDYTKSRLLDLDGRNISETVRKAVLQQMPAYRGIYNHYLRKNRKLGGKAKIFMTLDRYDNKMWAILLSNDFKCQELIENMNTVIMKKQYEPISFSGEEDFSFILPMEFRQF